MKQSARSNRRLVAAPTAPVETPLHLPRLLGSTLRTNKSVRPAQRGEVLFSGFLRGKSLSKLHDGLRIVWNGHGANVKAKTTRVNCMALNIYSGLQPGTPNEFRRNL